MKIWKRLSIGLGQDTQSNGQLLDFRYIFLVVPTEFAEILIVFMKIPSFCT